MAVPLTRVLFLAESFHPLLGGGETHVRRLGAALVAAGDEATVVTRRGDASWPAREDVDGIRVVRIPPAGPGRTGKFLMIPAALRAVLGEARRHDDCRYVRGDILKVGAVLQVDEQLHGRPHSLRLHVDVVVPHRLLRYSGPGFRGAYVLEPAEGAYAFHCGARIRAPAASC